MQPSPQSRLAELQRRLAELQAEVFMTEDELAAIEAAGQFELGGGQKSGAARVPHLPADKVALFLEMFGTRRTVYPKLWQNPRTGKKGYAPACDNEWRPGICRKPQVKCSECLHQKFPALDERAIEAHLRGEHTLGVYAIREDDSCLFLAADFDGSGWKEDVAAYRAAGLRGGVTVAVERSRSGNGGHGWIFFNEPVPATMARRLGAIMLARASAFRPTLSLDAYDRLFPNQDTIPPGGFGNLIALPLAKGPRQQGNTTFLDQDFRPVADQWDYLANLPRLTRAQLQALVARLAPLPALSEIGRQSEPEFMLECDEATLDLSRPLIRPGSLSGEITLRLDSKLHIPRSLPAPILAALRRLGSMANPVFHEKLRLRFPTFDTPRFLFAGEWHADRLVLPRGCFEPCVSILETAGASVVVQEQREIGTRVGWKFEGELRPEQAAAVKVMLAHDCGVLCAPPGAGKTVMGCALIARHRTATLVLVHRSMLLDQWRGTAIRFLGLKKKEVGVWKGARPRLTRRLDLAMMPSLSRVENLSAVFAGYGLVMIDECHHVPAASFEALLKDCPARRIVGLTATPARKDRLEKLLYLQCGPIRHTISSADTAGADRVAVIRRTSIALPANAGSRPELHEVWTALMADAGRMAVIVADIAACLGEGRAPLVLADRKAYLEKIETALATHVQVAGIARYRLDGGVGKTLRRDVRAKIERHYAERTPFVLLATASLIGEGFDLPQLDTLVLAMPLSFKGRLIQYAGRLHRTHEEKASPRIYDYVDENNPITKAMFHRRSAGYRQMGYRLDFGDNDLDERLNFPTSPSSLPSGAPIVHPPS